MDLDKEIETYEKIRNDADNHRDFNYYCGVVDILKVLKRDTYSPKDNLSEQMDELSSKVLNKFPNVALTIATEECAELIQAITKLRRGKAANTDNLAEEIADVLIVIHWLKHKYRVTDEQIEKWLDFKIKRCNERLDNGEFR